MKIKIDDTNKNMVMLRKLKEKKHRDLRSQLLHGSRQQCDFLNMQNRIMPRIWDKEGGRLTRKLEHLTKKMKKEEPEIIEEVKVGDAALGPLPEKTAPLIWGGEQIKEKITEEMKSALSMPPGTTKHDKIDLIEVETNIEIMSVKIRWELQGRSQHNRDQIDGDHRSKAEIIDKNIQNPETGNVDMRKLKVSMLKTKT